MNKKHESTISVLQTQISNVTASNLSMQGQIKELEERVNRVEGQTHDKIDILEQYSRRQSLRIEGVKINEYADEVDPVMEIVESCFNEAGLTYSSTVIDRAHRVGPVYKNRDEVNCQSIIVKFSNFNSRTEFYRKRKSLQNKRVRIDLTKKNYKILKDSINLINEERGKPTAYIFADINCRLKLVD